MFKADSTLFTDNDLSEPLYSGQVIAHIVEGSGSFKSDYKLAVLSKHYSTRRLFKRTDPNSSRGIWVDDTGERFLFSDLRDIVIINKGITL